MRKLMGDQDHIRENLFAYVQGFSPAVRDIFERFEFAVQIERLAKSSLLYQVTEKFAVIDLHPDKVDNFTMGLAFEELIRKFAELSNETAGEHFTPRGSRASSRKKHLATGPSPSSARYGTRQASSSLG